MREELLAHLLGLNEPHEREELDQRLQSDPQLQQEFELLKQGCELLDCDREEHEPPPGLASRTCALVAHHCSVTDLPLEPSGIARWGLQDFLVAACVMVAASLLFFPAMGQSRWFAQRAACQHNLRAMSTALVQYSDANQGMFPFVPQRGKLAAAGIYAPKLLQGGYLDTSRYFVCPSCELRNQTDFRIPTVDELVNASAQKVEQLRRVMGGSYGYTLGYTQDGVYYGRQNQNRTHFALMADAPNDREPGKIGNCHGTCGQNVLFEDGHVDYITACQLGDCTHVDNFFLNAGGKIAAGLDADDSVIARSHYGPLQQISLKAP